MLAEYLGILLRQVERRDFSEDGELMLQAINGKSLTLRGAHIMAMYRHLASQCRKPRDWPVEQPGDLVQVDTLELQPLPGVVVKQFTARDVISRWDVLEAHGRAVSRVAAQFLEILLSRMSFPVRALQVDGGTEFAAAFEDACQQRGLKLFVLPHAPPLS